MDNFESNTVIIDEYLGFVCTLGKHAEDICGIRTLRAGVARMGHIHGTQEEQILMGPGLDVRLWVGSYNPEK